MSEITDTRRRPFEGTAITFADIDQQISFSKLTFGPGERTAGLIDHITKELKEIEAAPKDLMEWVDIIILAIDGAWRAGFSSHQIIAAYHQKMRKNRNRKWPDWRTSPLGKAIEHIKRRGVTMDKKREPDYLSKDDDDTEFDKLFGDWRQKANIGDSKAMEILFIAFMAGVIGLLIALGFVLVVGLARWIWVL